MYSYWPYASSTRGHPYQYQTQPNSYGYAYSQPDDTAYLRDLADEQAARDQYLAARRAQDDARERAARARLARQFNSPYNSYLEEDSDDGTYSGYGYGYPSSRQARALEEQRRRQLMEIERQRLEQERRLLEEERRRIEEEKRRTLLEEERQRRLLEEEQRRQLEEEAWRRQRQSSNYDYDPFMRAFGLGSTRFSDEEEEMRPSRAPTRARTQVPPTRRAAPSQEPPLKPTPLAHSRQRPHIVTNPRSVSVPPQSKSPVTPSRTEQAKSPRAERVPSTSAEPVHIPISSPRSPPKPTSPHSASPKSSSSQPAAQPSPKVVLTPEQEAAAQTILAAYRKHAPRLKALRALATIAASFNTLKHTFHAPAHLDYQLSPTNPAEHISIPTNPDAASTDVRIVLQLPPGVHPRLAYTSNNAGVHAYTEKLNQLLSAVDAVESGGNAGVRKRRKELARSVELEAERVEGWVRDVWDAWARKTSAVQPLQVEQATQPAEAVETSAEPMEVEQLQPAEEPSTSTTQDLPAPVVYHPVHPTALQAEPASPVIYHPVAEAEAMEVEPLPTDPPAIPASIVDDAFLTTEPPSAMSTAPPSAMPTEPATPADEYPHRTVTIDVLETPIDESEVEADEQMQVEPPSPALTVEPQATSATTPLPAPEPAQSEVKPIATESVISSDEGVVADSSAEVPMPVEPSATELESACQPGSSEQSFRPDHTPAADQSFCSAESQPFRAEPSSTRSFRAEPADRSFLPEEPHPVDTAAATAPVYGNPAGAPDAGPALIGSVEAAPALAGETDGAQDGAAVDDDTRSLNEELLSDERSDEVDELVGGTVSVDPAPFVDPVSTSPNALDIPTIVHPPLSGTLSPPPFSPPESQDVRHLEAIDTGPESDAEDSPQTPPHSAFEMPPLKILVTSEDGAQAVQFPDESKRNMEDKERIGSLQWNVHRLERLQDEIRGDEDFEGEFLFDSF